MHDHVTAERVAAERTEVGEEDDVEALRCDVVEEGGDGGLERIAVRRAHVRRERNQAVRCGARVGGRPVECEEARVIHLLREQLLRHAEGVGETEGCPFPHAHEGRRVEHLAQERCIGRAQLGAERLPRDHEGHAGFLGEECDHPVLDDVDRPGRREVSRPRDDDAARGGDGLHGLPSRVIRRHLIGQDSGRAIEHVVPTARESEPRDGADAVAPSTLGGVRRDRHDVVNAPGSGLVEELLEHRLVADVHHLVDNANIPNGHRVSRPCVHAIE